MILDLRRVCVLGKVVESGEHNFGTRGGTFTRRTVKRLPKCDRADRELILEFIGTPWDRKAEKPRGRPKNKTLPLILPLGEQSNASTGQPGSDDIPRPEDRAETGQQ